MPANKRLAAAEAEALAAEQACRDAKAAWLDAANRRAIAHARWHAAGATYGAMRTALNLKSRATVIALVEKGQGLINSRANKEKRRAPQPRRSTRR